MPTLRLRGQVDEQRQLSAKVPPSVEPGQVEIDLVIPAPDGDGDVRWDQVVAQEWAEELSDTREDLYCEADGDPVDEAR